MSPDLSLQEDFKTTPVYLFGEKNYKSTLIKKCDSEREDFYEIKITGKKAF